MKRYGIILTLLFGLLVPAGATVPKDPHYNSFRLLPARSPFVIKKKATPVAPKVANSALTLRGVSKFNEGWVVTVVDRKKPKENIILREGASANEQGMRLLKVNQAKDGYANTTAVVLAGGRQVTVRFNMNAIKSRDKQSSTAVKTQTNKRPPLPISSKAGSTATPKKSSSGRRPRVRRTTPKK